MEVKESRRAACRAVSLMRKRHPDTAVSSYAADSKYGARRRSTRAGVYKRRVKKYACGKSEGDFQVAAALRTESPSIILMARAALKRRNGPGIQRPSPATNDARGVEANVE